MNRKLGRLLLASSLIGCSTVVNAVSPPPYYTITNGELVVNVRTDNGAIDDYSLNGVNFFGWGSHVSDWGMQQGTDESTFALNTTDGSISQPVTVAQISPTEVRISGTYAMGTANVNFVRTLQVAPSENVLLLTYTLTNNDVLDPVTVAIFETFDPDQGQGTACSSYSTYMDVVSSPPYTYGDAVDCGGMAFVLGSYEPDITVASGSPFALEDGNYLNLFFSAPYDGNEEYVDEGTHIGFRTTLPAGGTVTFKAAGAASSAGASAAFTALTNALPNTNDTNIGNGNGDSGLQDLNEVMSTIPPSTESESSGGGAFNPLLLLAMGGLFLARRRRG